MTQEAAISNKGRAPGLGVLAAGSKDSAEICVFLHGWGGSKELWHHALEDLSGAARCVALDLPGTGGTSLPDDWRSMSDLSRWVRDTCDLLGLREITLIGHSLGGNLAVQTALDYPDLARRLVLVDAALETDTLPWRSRLALSPRYGLMALRLMRLASWPLAVAGRRVPDRHGGGDWAPFARRTRMYLDYSEDRALQILLQALHDNPICIDHLAKIAVPLLLIHGAQDHMVPISGVRAFSEKLPDAHLVVFEAARHCPMDTDPSEFAGVIREFIEVGP